MIEFSATGRMATASSNEYITEGSVGIPVSICLNSDFDSLQSTIVFECGDNSADVPLMETPIVLPSEILVAGKRLSIGVYATDQQGTVVIPTVWAGVAVVRDGAKPSGIDPVGPAPSWAAQVQSVATEAINVAQSVRNDADSGAFDGPQGPIGPQGLHGADGVSPTISVTDIAGGHRVTITDATGDHSFDVMDGGAVTDVQVNGASIVSQGVANVPVATSSILGVVRVYHANGIVLNQYSELQINYATDTDIKSGTNELKPIGPLRQHKSTFYGLAKAAGADMANIPNTTVGIYPETQKSAIASMLNAPESISGSTPTIAAKAGVQYVCGECATLDVTTPATGVIDVIFESGSTPTVLTVTPPSGMTMKWANDFDPTSLDANTTYELNVLNGCLGVCAAWT